MGALLAVGVGVGVGVALGVGVVEGVVGMSESDAVAFADGD